MKKANKFSVLLLDLLEISFIAVAVFILVYVFVGQPLEITGDSMHPTLFNKEQIVAEKVSGKITNVKRGDIVVFKHPQRPDVLIIKRVIGLPGEKFELVDGYVYINDERLTEGYIHGEETYGGETIHTNVNIIVPSDEYVLLGDNRTASKDSRAWGTVSRENIIGKALFVFYPLENIRIIDTNIGVQNAIKAVSNLINTYI